MIVDLSLLAFTKSSEEFDLGNGETTVFYYDPSYAYPIAPPVDGHQATFECDLLSAQPGDPSQYLHAGNVLITLFTSDELRAMRRFIQDTDRDAGPLVH
jgi:hypothetical protein